MIAPLPANHGISAAPLINARETLPGMFGESDQMKPLRAKSEERQAWRAALLPVTAMAFAAAHDS